MTPEQLKKALQTLVLRPDLQPTTYCNFGLFVVANLFGCHTFDGRPMANTICDILEHDKAWRLVDGPAAHAAACAGSFVVACRRGPQHGHVATVAPAEAMYHSGSWAKDVPWVANIGAKNDIMGTSQAFKEEPLYYIWDGLSVS